METSIIAKVIDTKHPLYGQTCHVSQVSDNLYRISPVDETWHSSHASVDQLAFVPVIPLVFVEDEDEQHKEKERWM